MLFYRRHRARPTQTPAVSETRGNATCLLGRKGEDAEQANVKADAADLFNVWIFAPNPQRTNEAFGEIWPRCVNVWPAVIQVNSIII